MRDKFPITANVQIIKTNIETKEQKIYKASNRVSRDFLYGISRMLVMQTINTNYVPTYILFGNSNTANPSDSAILPDGGFTYAVEKSLVSSDQTGTINNDLQKWRCVFTAHVAVGTYSEEQPLNEIGLFGSNGTLLARAVIPPEEGESITQGDNQIIDIEWTIIFTSVADPVSDN